MGAVDAQELPLRAKLSEAVGEKVTWESSTETDMGAPFMGKLMALSEMPMLTVSPMVTPDITCKTDHSASDNRAQDLTRVPPIVNPSLF